MSFPTLSLAFVSGRFVEFPCLLHCVGLSSRRRGTRPFYVQKFKGSTSDSIGDSYRRSISRSRPLKAISRSSPAVAGEDTREGGSNVERLNRAFTPAVPASPKIPRSAHGSGGCWCAWIILAADSRAAARNLDTPAAEDWRAWRRCLPCRRSSVAAVLRPTFLRRRGGGASHPARARRASTEPTLWRAVDRGSCPLRLAPCRARLRRRRGRGRT